jgi:hypothetical protein
MLRERGSPAATLSFNEHCCGFQFQRMRSFVVVEIPSGH